MVRFLKVPKLSVWNRAGAQYILEEEGEGEWGDQEGREGESKRSMGEKIFSVLSFS